MDLHAFTTDDILKDWMWKGKPLPPETIQELRDAATAFQSSTLWKILKSEVEWFAAKTLIEKGETADDIRFTRLLGNMVQVMDKKLAEMITN